MPANKWGDWGNKAADELAVWKFTENQDAVSGASKMWLEAIAITVHGTSPDGALTKHGACNVRGRLAIFGGESENGSLSAKLYILTPMQAGAGRLREEFVWSEPVLPSDGGVAPQPRSEFAMHSAGGAIYIFGGSNVHNGAMMDLHSARLMDEEILLEEEEDEEDAPRAAPSRVQHQVKWMSHKLQIMNQPGVATPQNERRRRKANSCVIHGKLFMFDGDNQDARSNSAKQSSSGGRHHKPMSTPMVSAQNAARAPGPLCLLLGGEYFVPPPSTLSLNYERLFHTSTSSGCCPNTTFADVELVFEMARLVMSPSKPLEIVPASKISHYLHKCMLGARSSYFYHCLQREEEEEEKKEEKKTTKTFCVDGPFFSSDAIQLVLIYLYTGGGFDENSVHRLCSGQNHDSRRCALDILRLTLRWWGSNDPLYQHVVAHYFANQWIENGVDQQLYQDIILEEHERWMENQKCDSTTSRPSSSTCSSIGSGR